MAGNGKNGAHPATAHPDTVAALKLFEEATAALTAARDEADEHRREFQAAIKSFSSERLKAASPDEQHRWRTMSRAQAKLDGRVARLEEGAQEAEIAACRERALDLRITSDGSITEGSKGAATGTLRDAIDHAVFELDLAEGSYQRLRGRGSSGRDALVHELRDRLTRLWSTCALEMERWSDALRADRMRREGLGKRFERATPADLTAPRPTPEAVDAAVMAIQTGEKRARGGVL